MRLNLWSYKNADLNNPVNFYVIDKLLTFLYGDVIIAKEKIPGFSKNIIKAIQAKRTSTIHLEQLKFDDAQDQELFYKMLKGSKNNYPSLLNYVTFKNSSNHQICIACADYTILASLFNEKIAETLTFNKNDPLEQTVIDNESFQKIISSYCIDKTYLPSFRLKHKKSNSSEIVISSEEENTHIQLNQKMPLNINGAKKNS